MKSLKIVNLEKKRIIQKLVIQSHMIKKKLSCISKENNIAEENLDKIYVLTTLRKKYQYTIHNNKYCYVQENRHLNLTSLHLKLWTSEIVNIIILQINYFFILL